MQSLYGLNGGRGGVGFRAAPASQRTTTRSLCQAKSHRTPLAGQHPTRSERGRRRKWQPKPVCAPGQAPRPGGKAPRTLWKGAVRVTAEKSSAETSKVFSDGSKHHTLAKNGNAVHKADEDLQMQDRRQSSLFASTSGVASDDVTAQIETSKATALIQSGKQHLGLDELMSTFKFPLDGFQKDAIQEFLNGHSVLVCAPTGAGKTAIAEAATIATLAKGLRVIYTTPLKALSNQKLHEMRQQFGHSKVGLQTGDVSLNAEGDIVIMTTEVLRNMLYRPGTFREDQRETTVQSGEDRLSRVGLVVLDEVHYLGNEDRGSVWEEAIISCHNHIPLLCMSATVSNPEDLGGWITKVHGSCKTVVTEFRPVPLYWGFCRSFNGKTQLSPLLDDTGRLHPDLSDPMTEASDDDEVEYFQRRRGRRSRRPSSRRPDNLRRKVPSIDEALKSLKRKKLLPVIWFAFSRNGCDTSALQLNAQRISLVTKAESEQIADAVDELRMDQPEAVREALLPALLKGISSHHAGCLPAWKSLIENLYQRGLIKVVFATGTLAAGINMPARSTVISTTSRRTQTGHISLPHNELLQMAGRAGRRGFDIEGHCIFLQDAFTHASSIVDVLRAGPEPLQSHFSSGYGMVLKLLNTRTLEYARSFVQRSFYNYLVDEGVKDRRRSAEKLIEQAQRLQEKADNISSEEQRPDDVFVDYLKAKTAYQEKRKEHRKVFNSMLRHRSTAVVSILGRKALPVAVGIEMDTYDRQGEVLPALVVADGHSGFKLEMGAAFLCLTSDNRLIQIGANNVAALGHLRKTTPHAKTLPVLSAAQSAAKWKQLKTGIFQAPGSAKTARLATNLLDVEFEAISFPDTMMKMLERLSSETRSLQKTAEGLQRQASSGQTERADLRLRAEATRLRRRARAMTSDIKRNSKEAGSTWRSFENTLQVLVKAGALEHETYKATLLGSVARELNADNELWLAIVLVNDALKGVRETVLAGVVCAFVAGESNLRNNFTVKYECSSEVLNVIEALEPERERLYHLQARYGVEANLNVDLRLSGVAEAWAAGSSWDQITGDCSMDGGDIARLFSRTVDLLRQATYCSYVDPSLRDTARAAFKGMARRPITDLIA